MVMRVTEAISPSSPPPLRTQLPSLIGTGTPDAPRDPSLTASQPSPPAEALAITLPPSERQAAGLAVSGVADMPHPATFSPSAIDNTFSSDEASSSPGEGAEPADIAGAPGSLGVAGDMTGAKTPPGFTSPSRVEDAASPAQARARGGSGAVLQVMITPTVISSSQLCWGREALDLDRLPNEVLMHILGFLDVCDLLATSRTNHHLRALSLHPVLHALRLRFARYVLAPLLASPSRPTLAELIGRRVFLTHTTQISRRLARNLVAIRLSRRLPQRPTADSLVLRGVLPPECAPPGAVAARGRCAPVAPGLVARKRAVEKEKLKDGLRRWVGGVWRGEVRERRERAERAGVGRVGRLRRFWERVSRGDEVPAGG